MSRFMVQTIRFRLLVVALLVIGAAEPGALAQGGGGTGGGTIYYFHGGSSYSMWSMGSDGSNKTRFPSFGYVNSPSRDLHNGYRWFLSVGTVIPSYYPDGTPRSEVFAYREDYNPGDSDTYVQLTDDATLQPVFWPQRVQWLPGDLTISFRARRWEGDTPEQFTLVEGGLYTADLVYSAEGNIIGLAASPTAPTLDFPLDGDGIPLLGSHGWDYTGSRVVYNADDSTGSTGLWVADLSSGTQTQIYSGVARHPDWSPDGTKIAMSRGHSIYTIKPNGRGLKEVISPTYVGGVYCDGFGYPLFSPMGSHIVCIGIAEDNGGWTNDVFRATASGRSLTNLTESWDVNEFPLGWRDLPLPPECGVPADCDDGDLCTIDDCVGGVCVNDPIECDDGDACTADSCSGGVCFNDLIDCDDGDACSADSCDPVSGCENIFPACGPADGCCGPGCDSGNDPDCLSCGAKNATCAVDEDCCSNDCKPNGRCR